jgi:cysteine desulfurase
MLPFLAEHFGDPAGDHASGRAAEEALEEARLRVAHLLGAERDEIVFTSGGTESNNLALWGAALAHGPLASGHLVISALEHESVLATAQFLERLGYGLTIVGCGEDGLIEPAAVAAALRADTVLVSLVHANHEIGTVQPVRRVAEICRQRGILLHCDASQTAGRIAVSVGQLGVDLLTVSGHKMYAPKGAGALFVRRGVAIEPLMHGAGHEGGLRPGTPNVPHTVALGTAAMLTSDHLDRAAAHMASVRDRLAERLSAEGPPTLRICAPDSPRLPNTLAVCFPKVNSRRMLRGIPELCASSGSASQAGSEHLSPTLAAIGLTSQQARGFVRLSVGWYTDNDDVDRAASLLLSAWESSQRS